MNKKIPSVIKITFPVGEIVEHEFVRKQLNSCWTQLLALGCVIDVIDEVVFVKDKSLPGFEDISEVTK